MSIIATALKHLIAAGVTGDDLVRAVAEMEAAQPVRLDATAEKRRAYDRERKRKAKSQRSTGIPPETAESTESGEPPNDIYSNPPEPCEANASQPPFAEKLVSEWNAGPGAKGARKATKLDAGRKTMLRARLKEASETEILRAVANLAASKFHCGENDRGWRADLGWFLKPANFLKALEMDGPAPAVTPTPAPREQFVALCNREIERFRAMGNEREALAWQRKRDGQDAPRNGSTGPPRSVGSLTQSLLHSMESH